MNGIEELRNSGVGFEGGFRRSDTQGRCNKSS